ncbi:MAG: type II methionyl aminopeptidase [Candidatus Hodarchaeota archaeon]
MVVNKNYFKAGEIASKALKEGIKLVKPGASLFSICETIENRIQNLGGLCAFPVNISINHIAAHYTSPPEDTEKIPEKGVVKIDCGVHVDGYIADTAKSVALNPEYGPLVEAAEKALNSAIKVVRAGVKISKVSSVIEQTIKKQGFKPVENLTGHEMKRWNLHSGLSIPNVSSISTNVKLRENMVIAVEPFATTKNGKGRVEPGKNAYIYKVDNRSRRVPSVKTFVEKYKTMPFASRWVVKDFGKSTLKEVKKLVGKGLIISYPVLKEIGKGIVAQAEHTIIIDKNKASVTTKRI